MKFYIEVNNKDYGTYISETYEANSDQFEKIKYELTEKDLSKLDFYDKDGDFVFFPPGVVSNSVIKIKRK
jgi:hypothetical protein